MQGKNKDLVIIRLKKEEQYEFDEFYREVYLEISEKYGTIEEMNVCDNVGEHMLGNVYIKFRSELSAQRAVDALNNRWFDGRPIHCELSPVTDFRDACCRQNGSGECNRGGFCNFLHLKRLSNGMRRKILRDIKSQRRKLLVTKKIQPKNKRDDFLPKKYQYSDSEESSWSDREEEKTYDVDRSTTPLAFRADRYPSDFSDSDSEPDPEIEAHKQMLRRLRWEEIRVKFLARQKWDEDRERNFVFSLL
ncbi:unnamed protein product [Dracunculus medinensis]|uniref:RRM domain-containing protein n=1 Tax=Dracunculus medinensis TaxID=318479 RepID=A0A0N4UFJ2_DRAME|nr:unnamed protein product [Dracunculus medinensis]